MLTVKVFHRERDTDVLTHVADIAYRGSESDQRSPFDPTPAGIERALDHAWRRTNNVDGSWSQGPWLAGGAERNGDFSEDVTRIAPLPTHLGRTYGLRSSAVGDVFEIDGRRWEVASVGFKELI